MELIRLVDIIDVYHKRNYHLNKDRAMEMYLLLDQIWYAKNFFKQDLHIRMFLPWDEKNKCVIDKPEQYDAWINSIGKAILLSPEDNDACNEYHEAMEKVIFSDWKLRVIEDDEIFAPDYAIDHVTGVHLSWYGDQILSDKWVNPRKIEDLAKKTSGMSGADITKKYQIRLKLTS